MLWNRIKFQIFYTSQLGALPSCFSHSLYLSRSAWDFSSCFLRLASYIRPSSRSDVFRVDFCLYLPFFPPPLLTALENRRSGRIQRPPPKRFFHGSKIYVPTYPSSYPQESLVSHPSPHPTCCAVCVCTSLIRSFSRHQQ